MTCIRTMIVICDICGDSLTVQATNERDAVDYANEHYGWTEETVEKGGIFDKCNKCNEKEQTNEESERSS